MDGQAFSLYQQHDISSPIIFTTAYDQYLLEAFQTNGIAYLLKPIKDEDLFSALDKYFKLFKSGAAVQLDASMIAEFKQALTDSKKEYKKRFTIKKTTGIFLLNTADIAYILAENDLVYAIDNNNKNTSLIFECPIWKRCSILNYSLESIEAKF